MTRAPYPTDLSDAEWTALQPLIPPAKPGGRPREVDMREILNATFFVLGRGGGYRRLPLSFPPWQTVYAYVRAWKQDGTWERLQTARREAAQSNAGHDGRRRVALSDRSAQGDRG